MACAEFAPEARWVRPESLHVTLKFIGEKSERGREDQADAGTIEAAAIGNELSRLMDSFRSARAPRVFWIGIEAGSALTSLADDGG